MWLQPMWSPPTATAHIQACVVLYMLMEYLPLLITLNVHLFTSRSSFGMEPPCFRLSQRGICMATGTVGLLGLISEDYHCARYVSTSLYISCMLYIWGFFIFYFFYQFIDRRAEPDIGARECRIRKQAPIGMDHNSKHVKNHTGLYVGCGCGWWSHGL